MFCDYSALAVIFIAYGSISESRRHYGFAVFIKVALTDLLAASVIFHLNDGIAFRQCDRLIVFVIIGDTGHIAHRIDRTHDMGIAALAVHDRLVILVKPHLVKLDVLIEIFR